MFKGFKVDGNSKRSKSNTSELEILEKHELSGESIW